jgi:hypothetical protein
MINAKVGPEMRKDYILGFTFQTHRVFQINYLLFFIYESYEKLLK